MDTTVTLLRNSLKTVFALWLLSSLFGRQLPSPGETINKDVEEAQWGLNWSFIYITNYLGWETMYPVP